MTETILNLLIEKGLPITILGVIIYILYKRMTKLEDENKALQNELKESEKQHLITLHKATALMGKFVKKVNILMSGNKNNFLDDEETE